MDILTRWLISLVFTTYCVLGSSLTSMERCISNAECKQSLILDHEHGRDRYFHLSDISGMPDTFNAWQAASPFPDINYETTERHAYFYLQPILMPKGGSFEVQRICLNIWNVESVWLVIENSNVEANDYRHLQIQQLPVNNKAKDHVCFARNTFATAMIVNVTKHIPSEMMNIKHLRVLACGDKTEDNSLQRHPPEQRPIQTEKRQTCSNSHLVTAADDVALQVSSVNSDKNTANVAKAFMDSGTEYTASPGKQVVLNITPKERNKFGWVGVCLEVQNANSVHIKFDTMEKAIDKKLIMCDHSVWTRFCSGAPKADYLVLEKLVLIINPYTDIENLSVGVKGLHIKTCWDFLKQK